jgi:hypothetical protein
MDTTTTTTTTTITTTTTTNNNNKELGTRFTKLRIPTGPSGV